MTTVSHRRERIGEEIAHEINAMLAGELRDPRLEISIVVNDVRLSEDGRNARVFIGARGTEAEQKGAIKALEHAVGFIRHEILERLQLRRVPELHFTLDNSEENAARIDQLLKQMKQDASPQK
jgi:ribosome-binding factor A